MLIGLISDVHSNAVALSSILRDFDCLQVKTILHAGDIIGYNPYPNETIRIFQERNIYSVLGNHDRALITGNTQNFHPLALNALKWTSSVISRPERQYLQGLDNIAIYFIDKMRVGIVHGSPRDFNEYIYPKDLAVGKTMPSFMSAMNCDVLVLGHTHIQFQVEYQEGIVVNPGSVGQPRDGNPGAAFALLNTETRKVTLHRADYDHEKVIGDILKVKLPVQLAKRLRHGR